MASRALIRQRQNCCCRISTLASERTAATSRHLRTQRQSISLLHKTALTRATTTTPSPTSTFLHQSDLDHALCQVRQYDPAGYLPGQFLPTSRLQLAYYAVRSFWVETGLRHDASTLLWTNHNPSMVTPQQHLEAWQRGIHEYVFAEEEATTTSTTNTPSQDDPSLPFSHHPTLRLLRHLVQTSGAPRKQQPASCWTVESFDAILQSRQQDWQITNQYASMDDLIQHAEQSCGGLLRLVLLQQGDSPQYNNPDNAPAWEAARLVGIAHGLTNALRSSISTVSSTGRLLFLPQDIMEQYHVTTPRYYLSALGQGDPQGQQALQKAVEHIANVARQHLQQARALRPQILAQAASSSSRNAALTVLLPGLASETWLERLESHQYRLTDPNLRLMNLTEHAKCSWRLVSAYLMKRY